MIVGGLPNSFGRSIGTQFVARVSPFLSNSKRFKSDKVNELISTYLAGKKVPEDVEKVIECAKIGSHEEIISIQNGIDRCMYLGIYDAPFFNLLVEADQGHIRRLFEISFEKSDIEKVNVLLPFLKEGDSLIESLLRKNVGKNLSSEMLQKILPTASLQVKRLYRNQLIIDKKGVEVFHFSKQYQVPADLQDFMLSKDFFTHIPTIVSLIRWMKEEGTYIPFLEKTEKGIAVVLASSKSVTDTTFNEEFDWNSFEKALEVHAKEQGTIEVVARDQGQESSVSLITSPKEEKKKDEIIPLPKKDLLHQAPKELGTIEVVARDQRQESSVSLIPSPKEEKKKDEIIPLPKKDLLHQAPKEQGVDEVVARDQGQKSSISLIPSLKEEEKKDLFSEGPRQNLKEESFRKGLFTLIAGVGTFSYLGYKAFYGKREAVHETSEISQNSTVQEERLKEFQPDISNFVSGEVTKSLSNHSIVPLSTSSQLVGEMFSTLEKIKRVVRGFLQQLLANFWKLVSDTMYPAFESLKKVISVGKSLNFQ